LEALLEEADVVSRQEFSVEIEGIFGGKVDAEIEIDGAKHILDWKSVSHRDFLQGRKLWKIEKYVDQLSSYGNVLGLTSAIVVLVDRNTFELLEVPIKLDPEYGQALIDRAHETLEVVRELQKVGAKKFVETRRVPAAQPTNGCRFCPFQRQCRQEEEQGLVTSQMADGVQIWRI
jgi:hypothetical protein